MPKVQVGAAADSESRILLKTISPARGTCASRRLNARGRPTQPGVTAWPEIRPHRRGTGRDRTVAHAAASASASAWSFFSFSRTSVLIRPVTFRRMREPSGRQPSEITPTQVPFAASR